MSLPRTPPPPRPLEPRLKGLSPGQRAPGRVNSLPDLGPTVLASGQRGSFSLFTCRAGRATGSPNAGGVVRSPETTSISAFQSFSPLIIFPHRDHSQGSGPAPGLLSTGTSAPTVGANHGVGGSLLARDGMESRDSGQVLTQEWGV